ncbi:MAG: hypothetical protein ACP5E4_00920 [Candidatus Aenigmatarchaeota archaeon]
MKKGVFLGGREERRKKLFVYFALSVGLLFLIEIVTLPMMYQDVSTEGQNTVNNVQKFEKTWIFGNLTDDEKAYLIDKGRTVATYSYTTAPGFFELEQLVGELEGQMVLSRVSSGKNEVEFASLRDTVTVKNLTFENMFVSACEVLYYPPPDCSSFT